MSEETRGPADPLAELQAERTELEAQALAEFLREIDGTAALRAEQRLLEQAVSRLELAIAKMAGWLGLTAAELEALGERPAGEAMEGLPEE